MRRFNIFVFLSALSLSCNNAPGEGFMGVFSNPIDQKIVSDADSQNSEVVSLGLAISEALNIVIKDIDSDEVTIDGIKAGIHVLEYFFKVMLQGVEHIAPISMKGIEVAMDVFQEAGSFAITLLQDLGSSFLGKDSSGDDTSSVALSNTPQQMTTNTVESSTVVSNTDSSDSVVSVSDEVTTDSSTDAAQESSGVDTSVSDVKAAVPSSVHQENEITKNGVALRPGAARKRKRGKSLKSRPKQSVAAQKPAQKTVSVQKSQEVDFDERALKFAKWLSVNNKRRLKEIIGLLGQMAGHDKGSNSYDLSDLGHYSVSMYSLVKEILRSSGPEITDSSSQANVKLFRALKEKLKNKVR
ncbi:hypothetical protein [Borrelia anserina]|nr:hypothetical protein [Borrelia anserina]